MQTVYVLSAIVLIVSSTTTDPSPPPKAPELVRRLAALDDLAYYCELLNMSQKHDLGMIEVDVLPTIKNFAASGTSSNCRPVFRQVEDGDGKITAVESIEMEGTTCVVTIWLCESRGFQHKIAYKSDTDEKFLIDLVVISGLLRHPLLDELSQKLKFVSPVFPNVFHIIENHTLQGNRASHLRVSTYRNRIRLESPQVNMVIEVGENTLNAVATNLYYDFIMECDHVRHEFSCSRDASSSNSSSNSSATNHHSASPITASNPYAKHSNSSSAQSKGLLQSGRHNAQSAELPKTITLFLTYPKIDVVCEEISAFQENVFQNVHLLPRQMLEQEAYSPADCVSVACKRTFWFATEELELLGTKYNLHIGKRNGFFLMQFFVRDAEYQEMYEAHFQQVLALIKIMEQHPKYNVFMAVMNFLAKFLGTTFRIQTIIQRLKEDIHFVGVYITCERDMLKIRTPQYTVRIRISDVSPLNATFYHCGLVYALNSDRSDSNYLGAFVYSPPGTDNSQTRALGGESFEMLLISILSHHAFLNVLNGIVCAIASRANPEYILRKMDSKKAELLIKDRKAVMFCAETNFSDVLLSPEATLEYLCEVLRANAGSVKPSEDHFLKVSGDLTYGFPTIKLSYASSTKFDVILYLTFVNSERADLKAVVSFESSKFTRIITSLHPASFHLHDGGMLCCGSLFDEIFSKIIGTNTLESIQSKLTERLAELNERVEIDGLFKAIRSVENTYSQYPASINRTDDYDRFTISEVSSSLVLSLSRGDWPKLTLKLARSTGVILAQMSI